MAGGPILSAVFDSDRQNHIGIIVFFLAGGQDNGAQAVGQLHGDLLAGNHPQRVRQILFNLVGNALKFTQKGYVEVRANYTPGKDESGTLKFEVRDTGCGISETDQEKIASPYVQVGRMGRHGGTGLGLAICRQLVTAMDGEIELSSKPGQGTTFYVKLTGVRLGEKVARERLSATQQMKVVVPVTPPKDVRRVLLADDSRINLSVIRAMLARIGLHDVVTASNGVDALKALRKDPEINFVLTDMWMPEMDGQTLVAEIRRNAAWSAPAPYTHLTLTTNREVE